MNVPGLLGIPHLVIFDENCKMATDCGRDMVESDPEGKVGSGSVCNSNQLTDRRTN